MSCNFRRIAAAALAVAALSASAISAPAASAAAAAPAKTSPHASPHTSPHASPHTSNGVDTAKLDKVIAETLRTTGVPGAVVGLWIPGKVNYVRTFGIADKKTHAPMTPNMNFRIGSETKTFTATAILRLVDQGKVKLDDPISRYVPGVPGGNKITLRQLAEMRSGLFSYSMDDAFVKALLTNPNRVFTPQELLAYAFKHPAMFKPGAKFFYSNTNYILLGLVVEKVSGQKLRDFIKHEVLDPAHMRHTLFPVGAEFPSPHPRGYTDQTLSGKTVDATNWDPTWGWAAGAMISNLHDLHTWARVLATGTLLKPATQKERLRLLPTGFPGTGYGLGILKDHGWIGHNGSLPGYQSLTLYLPEQKATLVVLLNTDISYKGYEPTTLFGKAITTIATPGNVYSLPAPPRQ
jgi:D-alanyl-D-alanine carboxypeptidase